MDSLEPDAQSFIVKIWVEDKSGAGDKGDFRGHITHVTSNERRYLKDLSEIQDFIMPYLEALGVKPSGSWHLVHWLRRLFG